MIILMCACFFVSGLFIGAGVVSWLEDRKELGAPYPNYTFNATGSSTSSSASNANFTWKQADHGDHPDIIE